jgi:hypothetical protein
MIITKNKKGLYDMDTDKFFFFDVSKQDIIKFINDEDIEYLRKKYWDDSMQQGGN